MPRKSLFIINPDATIKTVNQTTLKLLGYEENELIGKTFNIIFGEGEESFKKMWIELSINNGSVSDVKKMYLTKDGREISVLFSSSVLRNDTGKIQELMFVATNISEHKQIENALLESKEKYCK